MSVCRRADFAAEGRRYIWRGGRILAAEGRRYIWRGAKCRVWGSALYLARVLGVDPEGRRYIWRGGRILAAEGRRLFWRGWTFLAAAGRRYIWRGATCRCLTRRPWSDYVSAAMRSCPAASTAPSPPAGGIRVGCAATGPSPAGANMPWIWEVAAASRRSSRPPPRTGQLSCRRAATRRV